MSRLLHGLLWASFRVGGQALCDALWGGDVKILMYHGITASGEYEGVTNYYRYNVPAAEFEQQLAYLGRHGNVISLSDLRAARRLSRTKPNVILSFDDGYENNYTNAFPLLARYGMPAVYALPTSFICERQPLWNDAVEHAVNHCSKTHVSLCLDAARQEFSIADRTGRAALNKWLLDTLVCVDQERRDALLRIALKTLDGGASTPDLFGNEDYRPLTREQVSEMTRSGVIEFASHSVHHYLLSRLTPVARRFELRESKRQVEGLTGVPCRTLCIPGGAYNDEVLRDAFSAGYEQVLTSNRGRVVPTASTLNRIVVRHRMGVEKFASEIHRRNRP